MGSLFSSNNKRHKNEREKTVNEESTINEKDRAILDLKNSRDRLKKFRKKLEKESISLQDQAKVLVKNQQKDRALLVLKLKRFREKEVNNIDAQLLSVLEMIENVEWEYSNMEVMKALKAGNNALNSIHNQMSVEDVEALLEETNEAIQVENEINELLAGQFNKFDNEELEKELSLLMGETIDVSKDDNISLPEAPNVPVLPVAPNNKPIISSNNENIEKTVVAI